MDENTAGIAYVESGIKYTPTPGTVTDIGLESKDGLYLDGSIEIQEVVNLELKFTP